MLGSNLAMISYCSKSEIFASKFCFCLFCAWFSFNKTCWKQATMYFVKKKKNTIPTKLTVYRKDFSIKQQCSSIYQLCLYSFLWERDRADNIPNDLITGYPINACFCSAVLNMWWHIMCDSVRTFEQSEAEALVCCWSSQSDLGTWRRKRDSGTVTVLYKDNNC